MLVSQIFPVVVSREEIRDQRPYITMSGSNTRAGILSKQNITTYIHSIMNPASMGPSSLQCPQLDASRYAALKAPSSPSESRQIRYFFALDLRECVELLPRLIGSVVSFYDFLARSLAPCLS